MTKLEPVMIYMTKEMKDTLLKEAQSQVLTMSTYIRIILNEHIKKK